MKYSIDMLLQKAILELSEVSHSLDIRPSLESEILLCFVLNTTRVYLHTHGNQSISQSIAQHYLKLIASRKKGKPIEYITQNANFYGRTFYVNSSVLIPRPETEILIDKAHNIITTHNIQSIAEIGIGSGVISITLALMNPQCHFLATDISKKALKVAAKNIATHAPNADITLEHTSILPHNPPPFSLIISNPPYLKDDYPINKSLSFEPANALFGGKDGLDIYRAIINTISHLPWSVWLLCEIGYDQKEAIKSLLQYAQNVCFYQDLSGWDRGFSAYFP